MKRFLSMVFLISLTTHSINALSASSKIEQMGSENPEILRHPDVEEPEILDSGLPSRTNFDAYFTLDFRKSNILINLTPTDRTRSQAIPVSIDYSSSRDTLIYGDYRGGFQKVSTHNYGIGLSSKLLFALTNLPEILPHMWANIGIIPIYEKAGKTTQFVKTFEEAAQTNRAKDVPLEVGVLEKWRESDTATFAAKGGVLFMASGGVSLLNIGATYLAEGIWNVYVEKLSKNRAYMKIAKGHLKSLSLAAGVSILTKISVGHFSFEDEGFSYIFDLNTKEGVLAYHDCIRGNIAGVQRLHEKLTAEQKIKTANLQKTGVPVSDSDPIKQVMNFSSEMKGNPFAISYGLPFIWNETWTFGKIHSLVSSDLFISGKKAKAYYGISTDEYDLNLWGKHKDQDYNFYGIRYFISDVKNSQKYSNYFGRLNFSVKNDKSSHNTLRGVMYDYAHRTGMSQLILNIPTIETLGHSTVNLDIKFSRKNVDSLMRGAVLIKTSTLVESISKIRSNFCKSSISLVDCSAAQVTDESLENTLKMVHALTKMFLQKDNDPKAFTLAFAKFGEAIKSDVLVLNLAIQLAGPGVEVNYAIEGTHISKYSLKMATLDDTGKLTKVSAVQTIATKK